MELCESHLEYGGIHYGHSLYFQ